MAARYFIPTSGAWAWDGAVWSATIGGSAGSAATPVTGDDVYILTGTADITGTLNQSAVALNSLTIGFSGTIGTSGASLQIGLGTGDSAHVYGAGRINLALTDNTTTLNVYDDFSGILTLTGGAIGTIVAGRNGNVVINAGTITGIETAGCSVISGAGATVSLFYAYGGNHLFEASIGTLQTYGRATFRTFGLAVGITSAASVFGNSTLIHDSAGTINNLKVYTDGTAVTPGNYGGFTVTFSTKYIGGRMFETTSVPITYTNATTKYGFR